MKIFDTKFPCILNAISLSGTTLASSAVYFHWIQGAMGFMTLLFSSGTAIVTCLIAIRRWYRGFKLEVRLKKENRKKS